jgi:hypothetical protein
MKAMRRRGAPLRGAGEQKGRVDTGQEHRPSVSSHGAISQWPRIGYNRPPGPGRVRRKRRARAHRGRSAARRFRNARLQPLSDRPGGAPHPGRIRGVEGHHRHAFTTEHFTGRTGVSVALAQTLDDCQRLLADECADWPEPALYMIGCLDEVR